MDGEGRGFVPAVFPRLYHDSEDFYNSLASGIEDTGRIFFEKNWAAYLTGAIHAPGFVHG